MVPYAIIFGEKYTYFIAQYYKFIENNKIEEGTLLNTPDLIDYHVEKRSINDFKNLERNLIHVYRPGLGEDDILDVEDGVEEIEDLIGTQCFNENNEMLKIFNQKCVISSLEDSIYAFRQCGHQCICEQSYQNKGDIDILKRVFCRT